MRIKHIGLVAMLAALVSRPASAELRHVELKTLGMDWETCAHAVRVAMQKVPGVTGVRVSLNEGLTILDLKPGNSVTLSNLRQVIRNNGFVTKEAQIVARGAVTAAANQLTFEVSGSKERLALSTKATPTADVVIAGTVDLSDPKRLRLAVKSTAAP